jgi:hypothetical protein
LLAVMPLTVSDFLSTDWESAELLLAPNCCEPLECPLYSAVMLCGLPATLRADVVQVALLSLVSATFEHPEIAFDPSLNVTVP